MNRIGYGEVYVSCVIRIWQCYHKFIMQIRNILPIIIYVIHIFRKETKGLKKGPFCRKSDQIFGKSLNKGTKTPLRDLVVTTAIHWHILLKWILNIWEILPTKTYQNQLRRENRVERWYQWPHKDWSLIKPSMGRHINFSIWNLLRSHDGRLSYSWI